MFPSFFLFGKEISMYMLMTVLGGLAVGLMLYVTTRKKPQYRHDQWLHMLLAAAGGAFVGAHLVFFMTRLQVFGKLITHWSTYIHKLEDVFTAFQLLFGGMVFYGGLFGALVGG